tara:strand:- start:1154 stop:1429 length:276 start_codon:yes stop_codon:yes gene_type:complete
LVSASPIEITVAFCNFRADWWSEKHNRNDSKKRKEPPAKKEDPESIIKVSNIGGDSETHLRPATMSTLCITISLSTKPKFVFQFFFPEEIA